MAQRTMKPEDPPFRLTPAGKGAWFYDCGPLDIGLQGENDPGCELHGMLAAASWDEASAKLAELFPGGQLPPKPEEPPVETIEEPNP